jgi:hypothetical protein
VTIPINEIKNNSEFYKRINLNDKVLSDDQKKFLNEEGYLIIPPNNFIKDNLKEISRVCNELIKKEGNKGGWEGKEKNDRYSTGEPFEPGAERLGNLVEKNEIFKDLLLVPEVIASAKEVIKSDIKLSHYGFRNPLKGCGHQNYHIDVVPRKKNNDPFEGVICTIFLDDTNKENGATRLIPKSHKKIGWPDEHIDPTVLHKDEISVDCKAGSILVFNLNTWHAGAKNLSGNSRKAIFIQIKRRDKPQLLNYKKYLKKETIKNLNSELRYLLAVRDIDPTQKEMSVGPGAEYRKYLEQTKRYRV